MENVFDQLESDVDIKNKIIENIIGEPVMDEVSAEDFTVADESEIDWSSL